MGRQSLFGVATSTPQRVAVEMAIALGVEQEHLGVLRRPTDAGVPPADPLWVFPPERSWVLVQDFAYEHAVVGKACRRAGGRIMIHWGVPWLESTGQWHMANPRTTERWVGPAQVVHPADLSSAGTVRLLSDDQPWIDRCSEVWTYPEP